MSAERVGKYDLLQRLAVGGMAELFLARADGLEGFQKIVVLKRILPQIAQDDEFIRMFLDEARLAATLDHPNIVHVHDIGRDGDEYFFTMEYLHGENLRALLRSVKGRGEAFPLEHAVSIAIGVAAGLHHAHEQIDFGGRPLGIVHRDISPSNILVTYQGGVKVLDFGIAKAAAQTAVTRGSTLKGKAAYMSPEQCRSEKLDRRSDIFAIGILLYEMTTGVSPFRGEGELATMHRLVTTDAEPPSSIRPEYPPELERIVMRALERDRADRYATALEMQLELEQFAREHRLASSAGSLAGFLRELFGSRPFPWASTAVPHDGAEEALPPTRDITDVGIVPVTGAPLGPADPGESDPTLLVERPLPPAAAVPIAAQSGLTQVSHAPRRKPPYAVASILAALVVAGAGGALFIANSDEPEAPSPSPAFSETPDGSADVSAAAAVPTVPTRAPTPKPNLEADPTAELASAEVADDGGSADPPPDPVAAAEPDPPDETAPATTTPTPDSSTAAPAKRRPTKSRRSRRKPARPAKPAAAPPREPDPDGLLPF